MLGGPMDGRRTEYAKGPLCMKSLFRAGCWTIFAIVVALVTLAFLFSPSRKERAALREGPIWRNVVFLGGDVEIGHDETVQGNLLVVGDDLKLEGRIGGNLVVVGGDADLDAHSRVGGNLSVIGGDADVRQAAEIGGNIAVVGGDASLAGDAYVGGNVNVVGGDVSKDPTAHIGGRSNLGSYGSRSGQPGNLAAPRASFFRSQDAPQPPESPQKPGTVEDLRSAAAALRSQADYLKDEAERTEEELERHADHLEEEAERAEEELERQAERLEEEAERVEEELERQADRIQKEAQRAQAEFEAQAARANRGTSWILVLLGRLVQAFLWTLLITGLVLLVAWLLPTQVERISRTAEKETALSFAAGAITLMGSALLAALLTLTICFALLALPLLALLALVILCGWTVTCHLLGRRLDAFLANQTRLSWNPLVSVALCSLLLTGVTMFAWAIFVCLGFFVAVLIGSTGAGAVIVHFARSSGRFSNGSLLGEGDGGNRPPAGTAGPDIVSPPPAVESIEAIEDAAQPSGPPQEPPVPGAPDDFSRLGGIGPTYAQRLREAGVTSFAQLAVMDVERLAAVLGWSISRVERSRLRERASELVAGN